MTQKSITSFFKLANQAGKKPLDVHIPDMHNSDVKEFDGRKKRKLSASSKENYKTDTKYASTRDVEQNLTAEQPEIARKHEINMNLTLLNIGRTCCDPFAKHKKKVIKGLGGLPRSLIDKIPKLNLTTNHKICSNCRNTLINYVPSPKFQSESVDLSEAGSTSAGYEIQYEVELDLQCHQSAALHRNIGIGWYEALKPEFSKKYFIQLSEFLTCERSKNTIYPPEPQVYSWTHYCDIKDIKVVILGQDPYHGVGQAHGLCFSVQIGVPPPPSLLNMYKELENDISGFKHPGHGYLAGWARQGVLLLNACLTVRASNANSHKDKGWEKLTDAVIQTISGMNKNVVFLLWGSYAQKKAAIVDKARHHLLNAPHPSPLSAHRGFFGCKHFSKCNKLLEENGSTPIDWSQLPPE